MDAVLSLDNLSQFVNTLEWKNVPLVHDVGWSLPITAVSLYVSVVVFLIPLVMKNRKPLTALDPLVIAWNFLLFVFNTTWAFWISYQLFELWRVDGIHGVICDPNERFWKGKGMLVIWGFLMSKFVELGDTLFLALRKKPISMCLALFRCFDISTDLFLPQFSCIGIITSQSSFTAGLPCKLRILAVWCLDL
jgi:hypothetical protein